MNDLIMYVNAAGFLVMGLSGLAKPGQIPSLFGVAELPIDMRNEVRAVYGGFGVAMAILLVLATRNEALYGVVALTVGVALLGMAGGRIVSLAIERCPGKMPYVSIVGECIFGGALLSVYLQ